MSIYIECINCGKQVICQEHGEMCYWCGKPADDEVGSEEARYNRNLPPLKAESIHHEGGLNGKGDI